MAYTYTARKRDLQSNVWDEENGYMLLLHPVSKDKDKAICGKELTAGSSRYGTRHLTGHLSSSECKQKAAARRAEGHEEAQLRWSLDDAIAVLQARSPAAVEAVQWRQGPHTILLLRERPQNMAELEQQGFKVLLLPEQEQLQAEEMLMKDVHLPNNNSPAQPCELKEATGAGLDEDLASMMDLSYDNPSTAVQVRSAAGYYYQDFSIPAGEVVPAEQEDLVQQRVQSRMSLHPRLENDQVMRYTATGDDVDLIEGFERTRTGGKAVAVGPGPGYVHQPNKSGVPSCGFDGSSSFSWNGTRPESAFAPGDFNGLSESGNELNAAARQFNGRPGN